MKLNLDKIGAVHDLNHDTRWSGAELAAEARRRAGALRRHCGSGGNRFVIAHANTPSFFADLLAVWEAGGCAVCVNPELAPAEMANVVAFAEPRAVLVDGCNVDVDSVPVLRTADEPDGDPNAQKAPGDLDDPALILFTSGTTGDPKGVVHAHRSILARLSLNQAHLGMETIARSLCVLPTHFGHGLIGNCLTPLLGGGDLFLMPGAGVAGTAGLDEVLERHRIRFMSSVPAFWKLALRVSRPPASPTLRRVHIGSAPLSAELWRGVMEWAGTDAVANMYGITETANWIGGAVASRHQPEDGLLGTPWGGHFAIRGSDDSPQAEGEGEIMVQVPSLMCGYYRRADLSQKVLRGGWYFTGDMGTIDHQGVLRITGRNGDAINRGGIKVYPEELDLLLECHADVAEACAFGVSDAVSGEVAAAAVRLTDGAAITGADLVEWVRGRIRPEAVPNRIYIVSDIPKTDRGKLKRDRVAQSCMPRGAIP